MFDGDSLEIDDSDNAKYVGLLSNIVHFLGYNYSCLLILIVYHDSSEESNM